MKPSDYRIGDGILFEVARFNREVSDFEAACMAEELLRRRQKEEQRLIVEALSQPNVAMQPPQGEGGGA